MAIDWAAKISKFESDENGLTFARFNKNDAYALGAVAADIILSRGVDVGVDIFLGDHHVFRAILNDCDKETDDWLPGKAAVARDFGESSMLVMCRHEAAGTFFTDLDLDHSKYRAFGGAVPIRVGEQVVGAITLSGTNDDMEHEIAIEALRRYQSEQLTTLK